ncbi:cytochrome P450 oxidoreductase [Apiospora kogelbergensis]|uniref:Cytochrome P450 oxidoreductase n=1 Tax=Apiospora kogelbergensis TaxID=1337665 RepID=A0AAW0RAY4_9PEZI
MMFSSLVAPSVVVEAIQNSRIAIGLGFCLLALLCWRIWRFHIIPKLYPEEPPEFPYWIPVLGSAISFFKDSHGTLTHARLLFGDTRKPFAVNVAGQKLYVLTSPSDVSAAYKNTDALTFDVFVRDVMVSFGASQSAVDKMWLLPESSESNSPAQVPNPKGLSLAKLVHDMHKKQLHPGAEMDILSDRFITLISKSLTWPNIAGSYVVESKPHKKLVSLKGWCSTVLLEAATDAFFGDAFLKMAPNLLNDFFDFDDNSWMLMYRYPRVLARNMYQSKQNAIDYLTAYLDLSLEDRPGAAWFVTTMEEEQRALGIQSRDIATLLMMVYWVVNSNTYKLCFWILSHLLHDPALLSTLAEETSSAIAADGNVDMRCLLDDCPRINAVYDEVLRLTNSSSSIRHVTADAVIGGCTLRRGNNVLIPYRQLHFNEAVFGPTAGSFDPERFLKDKSLARSPSYRPFGGGSTYCPGRFIARQEVVAFVAVVLNRYDIKLATGAGTKFPALEELKPCLGVMGPVDGEDIMVQVGQKAANKVS